MSRPATKSSSRRADHDTPAASAARAVSANCRSTSASTARSSPAARSTSLATPSRSLDRLVHQVGGSVRLPPGIGGLVGQRDQRRRVPEGR